MLEASNAEEAMGVAGEHQEEISLLLIDLNLPRTSGRALAGQLKTVLPQAKLTFNSGYKYEASLQDGYQAFLQKPFLLDTMALKVREVLDGAPQR